MEEEEEENIVQKQYTSVFSTRSAFKTSATFSTSKRIATSLDEAIQDSKMAQLATAQSVECESASSSLQDSRDLEQLQAMMTSSISRKFAEKSFSSKTSTFSRSGTSSSSQEDCEPELKALAQKNITSSGQYLTAARVETARSMESLRTPKDASPARSSSSTGTERIVRIQRTSFLTASERDVRELKIGPARRALSGEDVVLRAQEEREMRISAERRRGLFASTERKTPQQLSLPPPERRLTILSPHSPMGAHELLSFSPPNSLRGRRKKGMVLPKLVLPRSDSDGSDFFFDRCLIE